MEDKDLPISLYQDRTWVNIITADALAPGITNHGTDL